MPKTDSKATGKVSKVAKKTQVADQILQDTPVEMVPVELLVRSELNVRKQAPDEAKLTELADSIRAVGVLQNLIVVTQEDGLLGVVAGGRRLAALQQLLTAGIITPDYPVPVKKVAPDGAVVASLTENGQREEMHPADQIRAFRQLSESGKAPVEIGSLLGYSTRHVQKCLRLASMAPALLDALANNDINLDQLQALSASEDHQRQLDVWQNATMGYEKRPDSLRRAALCDAVSAENNQQLDFVGRDAYERAGGSFRYDLFTDEGFITEPALLERLTREKLEQAAREIAAKEGWKWAEGRLIRVRGFGEDGEVYRLNEQPENQEWTDEMRGRCGVVVSLLDGALYIQRGVMRCEDKDAEPVVPVENSPSVNEPEDKAKGLSSALVRSLSSERTLAVQAALSVQPKVVLALLVHDVMRTVFLDTPYRRCELGITVNMTRATLLGYAPTASDSLAMQTLEKVHRDWLAEFPDGWEQDCRWLLAWSVERQLALLAYCLAGTVDGVNSWVSNTGKVGGELAFVEGLIGFNLRDWWQPTKANFFGRITKDQITDALIEAECISAALDAAKMKKGDAAALAEEVVGQTRWVPDCLLAEVAGESPRSNEAECESANDVVNTSLARTPHACSIPRDAPLIAPEWSLYARRQ
ncbi:ParB/RepB/Spo0J family partition protein [Yersinia enterocolitica]